MSFTIKTDGDELIRLAGKTSALPEQIASVLVSSVNVVATAEFARDKDKIVEQVNLSRQYVDSKMKIDLAETKPSATITAAGRGVLLANFGAKQITKSASSRAKGTPSLGIPKGYRSAGIHVKVKAASSGGNIEHGFFMRLKNGNGMGVFTRDSSGRIRVRYGPSVDQVFSGIARESEKEVATQLENEILSRLEKL